ncbi:MAG: hypothetical protein LBV00_04040 [Propionibacteriaceae bacterium]|jgi:hypothetical protein|nr:hypothetical protein [Propionibacteriaceae bacterium]
MPRELTHDGADLWPDPSPSPFEQVQPQPGAKTSRVSVCLTSPPPERPPRPAWTPPKLPRLSERAIVIVTVATALAITGLITLLAWPRPPQLTDRQYLTMLTDTPMFHQTRLAGSSYPVDDLVKDVGDLPDELSAALERSADTVRRQYTDPFLRQLDCPNADLQANFAHLQASADLAIGSSENDLVVSASLYLFAAAGQAESAAQPFMECTLATLTGVPTDHTDGSSVVIDEPLTHTTESGATVWRTSYTFTVTDWMSWDENGNQTEHSEPRTFSNAITVLTWGNILAWLGGSDREEVNKVGVATIIAAIKAAR